MALTIEQLALVAKALSDPIRLRILDLVKAGYDELSASPPVACCSGGVCVCDIQDALDMAQSKVSYHLRELKQAGLLHETKQGKWNFYSINSQTLDAFLQNMHMRYVKDDERESNP
ncbi:helix-turn-helix transcriptional regulator [Hazenella sp. IB182357]|uniref:Helix-turn-helix transcriptional regulator n=1 Tax=Polycladospora coralii TaxID=2771432 RepID=A0A926N8H4_9BACL|nr:metalloregulator ArsR/SmtB family transcription factor [Polycladospora coralii]MBD1371262.1 helix-turn-helix transcriptional regulator [Polycladospora coralii]MBS7530217.1 helix-turn-helix transcriptional regulator [Polycladospora coralii]